MDQSSISPGVEISSSLDEAALLRTKLYAWLEALYLQRKMVVQLPTWSKYMVDYVTIVLEFIWCWEFFHTIPPESTLRTLSFVLDFAA